MGYDYDDPDGASWSDDDDWVEDGYAPRNDRKHIYLSDFSWPMRILLAIPVSAINLIYFLSWAYVREVYAEINSLRRVFGALAVAAVLGAVFCFIGYLSFPGRGWIWLGPALVLPFLLLHCFAVFSLYLVLRRGD